MKVPLCFITILILSIKICDANKKYKIPETKFGNPLSKMLGAIIIQFYSIESTQVTITRADKDHQSYIMQSGIINEFLYETKDRILVRMEAFDRMKVDFARYFNVFVLDYYQSFRKILEVMRTEVYDFTGIYTIVLTNVEKNYTDVVQKILQHCWKRNIVNVNLITYDPEDLQRALMYTYFPFRPQHCGVVKPVVSGVFENNTFVKNFEIFPDKVNNFFLCNITIGTIDFPPYMKLTPHGNGSYYYDGFEGIVSRVLGQRLNFSLVLKTSEDRWGKIDGENSTGLSGMLLRGEVNFIVGSYGSTFSHYGLLTSTISYHGTPLTLLIPPGTPYSPMEKLFLPMRYIIWSCLSASFIASAIVVTAAKFTTPQRRAFIFGRGNNYPFINTINVFLGGSMSVVPRRNFARFLLMLWILMSLVVRSSYQGSLFNFLTQQKNTSLMDTFPKMLKAGFKIYGVEGTGKYFVSTKTFRSAFVNISAKDVDNYRMKTTNPEFKGAVVTPALNVAYLNEKFSNSSMRFRICKEQIVLLYICIYVSKYSYLTKPFNKELWKYIESGLINRWTSIFYDLKFLKETPIKSIPEALTMNQLSGIFTAYIILMSLSSLVFLMEILSRRSRVLRRVCDFLN